MSSILTKTTTSSLCRNSQSAFNGLELMKLNNVHIENKTGDVSESFNNTIKEYKNKLIDKQYPVDVELERNQEFLDQIMEYAVKIPCIDAPVLDIDVEPLEFPEIQYEREDSQEIRNMIRKINLKTQTFTCDHSKFETKAITYQADALELRNNKELKKEIDGFYTELAKLVWKIKEKDRQGKNFKDYNFIISSNVNKIIEAACNFSAKVLKFNAKYVSLKCVKCEKLKKEYEYVCRQIEQLRQEQREIKEEQIRKLQQEVMTGSSDIEEFMEQYFPGVGRLKLMDVVKMWKIVNGKTKQEEMKAKLEETGQWRITNVHRIFWATRI